ncbi:pickpocket protein 28-like [Condylostylus longicornis]|uniref:pickpocket protein 28-like n=1 Tax=Condylostylus longicornis TaxID=2530218 RepID=UPI00244E17DA|nr:pickpocket protein 28-like [Condylostylus longicornis]
MALSQKNLLNTNLKYKKTLGFPSTPVIYFPNREEEKKTGNADEKTSNNNDFLINSSLHGLKYTANGELSIFERFVAYKTIFFIISFVFVVLVSGYFISNVWNKWKATPIIISTSPLPTFTSSIPFPSITICNLNRVRKSRVAQLEKGTYNYTLLWSLCNQDTGNYLPNYLGSWKNFRPVMLEMAQPCKEMLLNCSFGGRSVKCQNIFHSTLTDDGLCCNFNSVDPQFMFKNFTTSDSFDEVNNLNITAINWTPESGYPESNKLPPLFVPRIARGTGKHMGLTITLNASSQEHFCSSTKGFGFKVLVHSPIEQPRISNYGFLINTGTEARVDILPTYSDASPAVRSINKQVRNCLFSDEGNLSYYKTYTRKNCEQECIAKHMARECGCVLYYLPRLASDIKICGPVDNDCTRHIENKISEANNNITCEDCYPACFDLSYLSSISSVKINPNTFMEYSNISKQELILNDIAIVHFFYGSNFFRSMTKDEIIGFTEFLSNTGGLLGLFMGFSIFSLIEIVYFLTLRPYCNYKMTPANNVNAYYNSQRNKSELIVEHVLKYRQITFEVSIGR